VSSPPASGLRARVALVSSPIVQLLQNFTSALSHTARNWSKTGEIRVFGVILGIVELWLFGFGPKISGKILKTF